MEPTVKQRLDAVCAVIPEEEVDKLRKEVEEGSTEEEQESLLWNGLVKRYPISIHCKDREIIAVLAAYSCTLTTDEMESRINELVEFIRKPGSHLT